MDYGRLNRRELQALCKEHGIPAIKTNAYITEALGALLNTAKESEQSLQSVPDPAEVVKEKAKRTIGSKVVADVLEASEVDELSSQLAKSTLVTDSSELGPFVEVMIEDPSELRPESEIVAEAVEGPRRARTRTSKVKWKSINALVYSTPDLVEPTLEVVQQVEDPTDSFAPAVADFAPEPVVRLPSTYSRRGANVKEQEKSEVAAPELSPATEASALSSEKDTTLTENFVSVEEIVVEETTVAATAVTKKTKVKGGRPKKVKPVSTISVQILEKGLPPTTNEITSAAALQFPDSPMLGLAFEKNVLQAILNNAPIAVCETEKTEVASTPVKQGDDKENSLKNIDLQSLSIRTLQKEVNRRGLAKRNNTRSVGAEIAQQ